MVKRNRITLTKSECDTSIGKRLIDLIMSMCHDGRLEISEVNELDQFLRSNPAGLAAVSYLRAITREAIADGVINDAEAYALKRAFERIVPKDWRGIVSTHLESIGLPVISEFDVSSDWTEDDATQRQLDYIIALGGTVTPWMTKGQASVLIDQLLERRPPTPRQKMLLRFFDRLDLMQATKDEVSIWIDEMYAKEERRERAWERFKRETNHDPCGKDPTIVPVGAFRNYL